MRKLICVLLIILIVPLFSVSANGYDFVLLYLGDNVSVFSENEVCELEVFGVVRSGEKVKLDNSTLSWSSSDSQVVRVENGVVSVVGVGSFAVISCSRSNSDGTVAEGSMVIHTVSEPLFFEGMENYTVPQGRASYAKISNEQVHSGECSLNIFDGGGSYNRYDFYKTPGYCKSVREIWFYDNGAKTGLGATVYFQDTKGFVSLYAGVENTALDYYTYSSSTSARASYGPGGVKVEDNSGYSPTLSAYRKTTGIKRTEGWHQVTYVVQPLADYQSSVCTGAGVLTLYLDGVKIFSENYLPDRVHVMGLRSIAGASLYYDDILMYNDTFNHPAVVESVDIKGGLVVGETLFADVVTRDVEGDEVDKILYSWEASEDTERWQKVSDSESLVLTESFKGLWVRVTAIPVSDGTEGEGLTVQGRLAVGDGISGPSVDNLELSVSQKIGGVAAVSYDFTGATEDFSVPQWYVSDDGAYWSEHTTGKEMVITAAMTDKYIKCRVVPKDGYNLEGEAVESDIIRIQVAELSYIVAPDGSDKSGTGSRENPFGSLERALDVVRADRALGFDGHISILLRDGKYYAGKTTTITKEHGKLTIASYPGERAEITGGSVIDRSDITVVEKEYSDMVIDETAKKKLMKIDLSGYVKEIPDFGSFVHASNKAGYNRWLKVCVDGVALDKARWPNERKDDLVMQSVTYEEETGSYVVEYEPTDRPKKWSDESLKNAMVEGHFWVVWADAHAPQTDFDPEAYTFKTSESCFSGNYRPDADDEFYFYNIIEEIDLPGEAWFDREGLAVYFYPPAGFDEDSEITVSVSEAAILELCEAEDVLISGMDFTHVRNCVFNADGCKNVVFDGCGFMHYNSINTLDGDQNRITNCYFYDGGQGGVSVSGGAGFSGGGNIIENNVFQSVDTLKMSYSPAVKIIGYDGVVRKNEFYNSYHQVITLNGNDHLFEYNDIHHTTKWTGDMGAVYWIAGPTSIGHEFRYNYFHDCGSEYYHGWSQAMFWDDCQVGPYIHHNIFARATYPYDEGENPSRRFTLKANGGSYAYITNNIFADCAYAAQFQNNERNVGVSGNTRQQIDFWLRAYGKKEGSNDAWFEKLKSDGYFTDAWKENYKGTVWEEYSNLFSLEFYEEQLAHLDKEADKEELVGIARLYAPENANTLSNNVVYNTYKDNSMLSGSNGIESGTVAVSASDFEDYENDNFSLTEEALAKVRETIVFENIDMSMIGPDNKEKIVGIAPEASKLTICFDGWNRLTAGYSFFDADGHHESASEIKWYKSHEKDGDYEYTGYKGKDFVSPESGIYVKFSITPQDSLGISGATVFSEPVYVAEGLGLSVISFDETAKEESTLINITLENKSTKPKNVLVMIYRTEGEEVKRLNAVSSRFVNIPAGRFSAVELEIEGDEYQKVIIDLDTFNSLKQ